MPNKLTVSLCVMLGLCLSVAGGSVLAIDLGINALEEHLKQQEARLAEMQIKYGNNEQVRHPILQVPKSDQVRITPQLASYPQETQECPVIDEPPPAKSFQETRKCVTEGKRRQGAESSDTRNRLGTFNPDSFRTSSTTGLIPLRANPFASDS